MEIYVNRGTEGEWKVQLNGKDYTLPVYGHVAELPGKLLQYSALFDGKHIDYSKGEIYTYVDGNGTVTEFPEMTAANAYVLNQVNGETRLTPVPFEKAETIKGLKFQTASPLTQDGKNCGENIAINNGELVVDGKAFHYTVK